jgi:glycosyltransferase involved in cell wall biosynthesis
MKQLLTVHTAPEVGAGRQRRLIGAQPIAYCSQVAWSRGKHAPESAWVVPNGVDLPAFAPAGPTADPLADLAIPAGRRRIISVGSIIPSKNYAASVTAIKHLVATDDVQFLAAGAGNTAALRGEARRLGIEDRVTFLGPRADVPALLASSHLFLSASQREGMPIAVLEAFASGLPCVLTPIEEHQEVAAMVSGCLIAADSSPAALADACHRSLAAPVARTALQAARAPQLSVYSIGSCAARYQAIYEELLAR